MPLSGLFLSPVCLSISSSSSSSGHSPFCIFSLRPTIRPRYRGRTRWRGIQLFHGGHRDSSSSSSSLLFFFGCGISDSCQGETKRRWSFFFFFSFFFVDSLLIAPRRGRKKKGLTSVSITFKENLIFTLFFLRHFLSENCKSIIPLEKIFFIGWWYVSVVFRKMKRSF